MPIYVKKALMGGQITTIGNTTSYTKDKIDDLDLLKRLIIRNWKPEFSKTNNFVIMKNTNNNQFKQWETINGFTKEDFLNVYKEMKGVDYVEF